MKKYKHFLLTVFLSGMVSLLPSCAVNPVTGEREIMLLSESDEEKMGLQTDAQVVASYGVYNDDNLLNYVDGIGQKMARISHRPNLNYRFKIMDSPVINAFAVPGGYVYLTRGILAHINDEAELAGVIGHEIGHITARHSAKQYSNQQLMQVGLGIGSVISSDFAQLAGVAQQGLGLILLKFSRDNETQSDELGVQYSTAVGYDARKMGNLFETLDRMRDKQKEGGLPSWFSTHPNPADRVVDVRKLATIAQQGKKTTDLAINREQYLSKINGLVYGENPRQGFVEDAIFYHPDMNFEFPVHPKWQLANQPSVVQMVDDQQKALILFTVAEEKDLPAAAQAAINKMNSRVQSERNVTVNGFPAREVLSVINTNDGSMALLSYFVLKDHTVYVFHGLTYSQNYDSYKNTFLETMTGFNAIRDKSKLAIQPERIVIRTVDKSMKLDEALKLFGVAQDKMEELSLINGMYPDELLPAGSRIKLLERK